MSELTLIDRAFLLKKTALFHALDLEILLAIADKTGLLKLDPDESIFAFGSEGVHLYVIVSGEVAILDAAGDFLGKLGPGHFFGDESLFNESLRPYTAVCKDKAQLLSLARSQLLSIIYECPSVALQLLREYAKVITPQMRFIYQEGM